MTFKFEGKEMCPICV